jgi:hypothetical protein
MSKAASNFRRTDVKRAVQAVESAGVKSYTLRIERDVLEFRVGLQEEPPLENDGGPPNSFDRVLGTR